VIYLQFCNLLITSKQKIDTLCQIQKKLNWNEMKGAKTKYADLTEDDLRRRKEDEMWGKSNKN
jgi:hypothetical protein